MSHGQHHRTLALIGAAMALPLLVMLVALALSHLGDSRREVETDARERAARTVAAVDARLSGDLATMRLVGTAAALRRSDWPAYQQRLTEIVGFNSGWRAVVVLDAETGLVRLDTRRPYDGRLRPADPAVLSAARSPAFASVVRQGAGCPCVLLHARTRIGTPLEIVALIDPAVFQQRLMADTAPGAISAIVDGKGLFIARSLAFEERVGRPASVYVRRAVARGGAGVYPGTTLEGVRSYTAYATSAATGWSAHHAIRASLIDRPTALRLLVLVASGLLAAVIGAGLIALALRELSARRKEEARVQQAQKLEALGRLTGGIAHDFNNLLTVIIGNLDRLQAKLEQEDLRRSAERALDAARRGARLTGQLLAFSRSQRMDIGPVDLIAALAGVDDLIRQSVGADVRLVVQLDPAVRWVTSDTGQLELAVLNLAINARDAMPDGGAFTVVSRDAGDGRVELACSDTGQGMDADTAARAMEPFFTTKPIGRGTGLGLAQVYGLAQQSGGELLIDSAPGAGTTVRLLLPRADPPIAPAGLPAVRLRDAPVLVVDDDEAVRRFVVAQLLDVGCRVREADGGEAALAALASEPAALMIVDFAMPGLNGAETVRAARERRPELRALMISGYADTAAVAAADGALPLLRKPFDGARLLEAAAAALEGVKGDLTETGNPS